MRRIVVTSWVGVDDLAGLPVEETTDPVPGRGEALVAVEASNVSYVDALMCTGGYQFKPSLPFTPGGQIAGVVTAVGEGADRSLVGRRIAASASSGCASHVLIPASAAIALPESVGTAAAAAMLQGYGTMHFTYTQRTTLRPGETVVVLGASGGVGQAAIDLAKAAGARVIACASTDEKLEIARAVGADETICYGEPGIDLKTAIRDLSDGGADVVVDPIGGELAEPALRALRFNGRYLVLGFAAGIPKLPLNQILLNNRAVIGVEFGGWAIREPSRFPTMIAELVDLAASGAIHPPEPLLFPLEDTGRLFHAIMTRQLAGKAVVVP